MTNSEKIENKKLMAEQYETEMRDEYFYYEDEVQELKSVNFAR